MEKMKKNPTKKIVKSSRSKRIKSNENHWIESRARLVKILEASGFAPEKCATMITHRKKDARSI